MEFCNSCDVGGIAGALAVMSEAKSLSTSVFSISWVSCFPVSFWREPSFLSIPFITSVPLEAFLVALTSLARYNSVNF